MRLPVTHLPPAFGPVPARCAHLEALAAAARGLPLLAAARMLRSPRSRGRHGNALQWHLGLTAHDSDAALDWEDRIEVKLVSVWQTSGGGVHCDKLKVCDAGVDPYLKLGSVLFVFADRLSRVVAGHAFFSPAGEAFAELVAAYHQDPHFEQPCLFVESREHKTQGAAPAYYLAGAFLRRHLPLPEPATLLRFDPAAWRAVRPGGRDPLWTLALDNRSPARCARCGAAVHFDPAVLERDGWAPGRHAMPLGPECALRGQAVLHRMPQPGGPFSPGEQAAEVMGDFPGFRLRERVAEPADHLH